MEHDQGGTRWVTHLFDDGDSAQEALDKLQQDKVWRYWTR
jgi:hypothetical protein